MRWDVIRLFPGNLILPRLVCLRRSTAFRCFACFMVLEDGLIWDGGMDDTLPWADEIFP
jgi:hypothetical protein